MVKRISSPDFQYRFAGKRGDIHMCKEGFRIHIQASPFIPQRVSFLCSVWYLCFHVQIPLKTLLHRTFRGGEILIHLLRDGRVLNRRYCLQKRQCMRVPILVAILVAMSIWMNLTDFDTQIPTTGAVQMDQSQELLQIESDNSTASVYSAFVFKSSPSSYGCVLPVPSISVSTGN